MVKKNLHSTITHTFFKLQVTVFSMYMSANAMVLVHDPPTINTHSSSKKELFYCHHQQCEESMVNNWNKALSTAAVENKYNLHRASTDALKIML